MVSESQPLQLIGPTSPPHTTSSTTATVPRRSIAATHINRRLHIHAKRKWGMSEEFEQSGPSYTPYGVGESTSTAIAPASPHQASSSTTATVPRRSIAATHINRRLHIHTKRKWGMSEEFEQSGPSYTPYGVGESTSTAIAPASPHQASSSTT